MVPCDADYPPSGRGQGHMTHFYILGPDHIYGADEARHIKFVLQIERKEYGVHLRSHDLLKFWEISANISQTVHDRHIVTMEG